MKNIAVLKSISPRWVSMKANTAICFLLAGTTITLLNYENPAGSQTILVPAFSFTVN